MGNIFSGGDLPLPTTLMRLRKQDPSVDAVNSFSPVVVYSEVTEGPEDSSVKIVGLDPIGYKPEPLTFFYNPMTETEQFDAVHCFAVVRNVKTMFDQALNQMGQTFEWQWGSSPPLTVVPRFREESQNPFAINARYDRRNKRLIFDVWAPSPEEKVYLSQSYDIVAHEVGHAILDGLVPEYLDSARMGDFETGGLHESFGDLTVIFSLMWQFDVVESIMTESRGGVTLIQGFWNIMGEHFAEKVFGRDPETQGIRNLNSSLSVEQIPTGAVDGLGFVFTSSIFAALVDVFLMRKNVKYENPAFTLYQLAKEFLGLTLISFTCAPRPRCTLEQMARQFMNNTGDEQVKTALYNHFVKRDILPETRHSMGKKKMPPSFCKSVADD